MVPSEIWLLTLANATVARDGLTRLSKGNKEGRDCYCQLKTIETGQHKLTLLTQERFRTQHLSFVFCNQGRESHVKIPFETMRQQGKE